MKGYEKLDDVLARAYEQASQGKGKERHANDFPFHEQPMQQVNAMVGVGFSHGQAIKKIVESQNMAPEQAVHELLGAICYLAGSIITLESANDNQPIQVQAKMHEYLDQNYKLQLVDDLDEMLENHPKDWIKVPEGAERLYKFIDGQEFQKDGHKYYFGPTGIWVERHGEVDMDYVTILWERDKRSPSEERAYREALEQFLQQTESLDMFTWESKHYGMVTVKKGHDDYIRILKKGKQISAFINPNKVFQFLEG